MGIQARLAASAYAVHIMALPERDRYPGSSTLSVAGSSPCRATIPAHAGPPFQSMPGQRSGACRATILVMPAGV
jgi:hypothetical protein